MEHHDDRRTLWEIIDQYRKIVPFRPGHEDRAYDPGDEIHIVEINGVLTCPFLCYDLRFPELWRLAAKAGAELFTIGASWPAARANHWKTLNVSRAMENQAWVLGVNRTGNDPYLAYNGDSLLVSPLGEIVSEAQAASVALSGEVDPESRGNFGVNCNPGRHQTRIPGRHEAGSTLKRVEPDPHSAVP